MPSFLLPCLALGAIKMLGPSKQNTHSNPSKPEMYWLTSPKMTRQLTSGLARPSSPSCLRPQAGGPAAAGQLSPRSWEGAPFVQNLPRRPQAESHWTSLGHVPIPKSVSVALSTAHSDWPDLGHGLPGCSGFGRERYFRLLVATQGNRVWAENTPTDVRCHLPTVVFLG